MRESKKVCAYCVHLCVFECVCMCVYEREREGVRSLCLMCVYVCVCVRESERV